MPAVKLFARDQSGFTIVEIMIAVGIGGVVLLGAVQMYSTVVQMQTSSERGQDVDSLVNDVQKLVNSEPLCTASLPY